MMIHCLNRLCSAGPRVILRLPIVVVRALIATNDGFPATPGRRIDMVAVVGSQELAEARRHRLASLIFELEARRLSCRLAGAGDLVLRVANETTRRQAMVVATQTGGTWSYLWTGGGLADAENPAHAAALITRLLGQ
jgi:hypothetical protein